MANWTDSMQQTFEYYQVDPGTWKDVKPLRTVKSCTITRDLTLDTLGSATFDVIESVGECYIRVYLITIQNGLREKHPLGTFIVQTPASKFDGKLRTVTMDAYTPLIELKESAPAIGYYIAQGENIMKNAYLLTREGVRAPVVQPSDEAILYSDFIADPSDTYFSFLTDLLQNAKYTFILDEMGRVLFAPIQDTAYLQPIWTYNDGNSSILGPEISMDHDLYGIPNIVEVVYSNGDTTLYGKAVNDDPGSPTSIQNRGRNIVHRVTDPDLIGQPTQAQVDECAVKTLREMSCLEYTISYTHAYCPVRIGDCVRLDYARAGLNNVRAKVVSQNIKCELGCQVSEKAIFTAQLWG